MKFILFALSAVLLFSCSGNNEPASPFAEVLQQEPYAGLTDSIRKFPKRDDLYFRRAVLLNRNNLPEPALADFKKAWSLTREEQYAVGAGAILLDKKPDSAIAFLVEARKQLPESIYVSLLLARSYAATGNLEQALNVCNAVLSKIPDQVNTLLYQSELLLQKNDAPGAVIALEKAYAVAPSSLDISNKLSYQYAETKNIKAIALADSLIAKDSLKQHAEPLYVKAVYYSNVGDRVNAIRFFDETIQRDHHFLNAYIEKGKIQVDQKKIADAYKTFQLANTISPAFPDAWYWMGRCLEMQGQKQEAKTDYERAYGLDKTFTEAKEAADKIPDE